MKLKPLANNLLNLLSNFVFEENSYSEKYKKELSKINCQDFFLIDANDDFELRINSNNIEIIRDKNNHIFINYCIAWYPTIIGKIKMSIFTKEMNIDNNEFNKIIYIKIGTSLNLNTLQETNFLNCLVDRNGYILSYSDKDINSHKNLVGFNEWRTIEIMKYIYGQLSSGAIIKNKKLINIF